MVDGPSIRGGRLRFLCLLFTSIKQWEKKSEEDIEEERRLCYVGMTRARQAPYLMKVLVRRIWGNVHYQDPSRFLEEMRGDLVELLDVSRRMGFGDARPAAPVAPRGGSDPVGQRLDHPEYGPGTVLVAKGSGDDRRVTAEFRGRERRKFLLRYVAAYRE